jgi:hypothetical protein
MFQSMMWMVTGGKQRPDVEDVGAEYGFVLAPGAKRPDGWAYRFPRTNTTILYHWSSTLASFSSVNWGEKHCIRIPVAFRLYLVKIIQILTN